MNKTLISICLVALALAPVAHAGTSHGSYQAPGGVGGVASVTCTDCLNAVAGQPAPPEVNVGGAILPPTGGAWLSVTVLDASGGPVAFSVGQDLDGDALVDVRSADQCGTTLDVSGLGFDATLPISVFVNAASPDCSFVATAGDVFAETA